MDAIYFARKIKLHDDAVNTIEKVLEKTSGNVGFTDIIKAVETGETTDEICKKAAEFAKTHNIDEFQFALALICACADIMKSFFDKNGYSEALFWSSAMDFNFKANECMDVYGFYGNFVLGWSIRVIRSEILRFGRLEFEETCYNGKTCCVEHKVLSCGDRVLSVHIPSDGPLLLSQVYESFKQAYSFYTKKQDEVLFVMCSSWLLYPPFVKLFKKNGNMQDFANLFTIVAERETEIFESGWRVFGTRDLSDFDKLPKDTTLHRNMARYLQNGGSTGAGIGVIPLFKDCELFKENDDI